MKTKTKAPSPASSTIGSFYLRRVMGPCKRRILGTSRAGTQLGVMTCFVRHYWLQPLEISQLLQNGVPLLPHFELGGPEMGTMLAPKLLL